MSQSMTRRTFIKLAGGTAASVVLSKAIQVVGAETEPADVVFKNGPIVTMSDRQGIAEAVAIRGDSVLAVGSEKEIAQRIGARTQVIDLAGRSLSPGLIDAHSHVIAFGHMETKFVIVRPPKINSFETLGRALAAAAAKKPKGEWIVARGFSEFKEGRIPRRQELDEYVPNHPVLAIHWGGQFGVANTLAMKTADLLRADAKDPYGGLYLRDKRTGLPDGVLIHYPAIYSVYKDELSDQENVACAEWGQAKFVELGVTCIHDNFCTAPAARAYVSMERAGKLLPRIRVYPYVPNLEICKRLLGQMKRFEGRLARLAGVKLAVDGYALMYKVPEKHREMAIPMHPQDQFEAIIAAIHEAHLQADVHAVGDKGVDWTLAAYAKAAGSNAECRKRRHRIEHFPFLKADTIGKAADMGVPVCEQPAIIEVRADDFLQKFEPDQRKLVETMVPLRTMLKAGVCVAFGADVPAFPSHRPLDSIRCAMDRKTLSGRQLDKGEAISFMEALKMHTLSAAYLASDEDKLGSLEPGKLADLAVWNKDLRKISSAADLKGLAVVSTYVGGKRVYAAQAAAKV